MNSHLRLPHGTPTCDSNVRTDGRTNEESWLRTRDIQPSVTPARTYGDSLIDLLHEVVDALEASQQRIGEAGRGQREDIHPWTRRAIYWRDANRCAWCATGWGDPDNPLELDHITPWSAGGSDRSDNLRTLCRGCNTARSNFTTDIYARVTPVGLCDHCHARRWGEFDAQCSVPIFCGGCGLHRIASDPRRVL